MEKDNNMTSKSPTNDVIVHRQGESSKRVVNEQNFDFEGWKITVSKSTILPSNCYCATNKNSDQSSSSSASSQSSDATGIEIDLDKGSPSSLSSNGQKVDHANNSLSCQVCRFASELSIKHLPEMVFPDNILRLEFQQSGFVLEFNALDAMKLISDQTDTVHVACSDVWKAAQERDQLQHEIKYDWTYSTTYKGTLHAPCLDGPDKRNNFDTDEQINLEKLKQREKILFFEELSLYEDELHDNGTSNLSVKIRVMPSGFFILLRFFLRVDGVMAKICDTRVYFETGNNYLLREFQERKDFTSALNHLPPQIFSDPNLLYTHLPLALQKNEKIPIV